MICTARCSNPGQDSEGARVGLAGGSQQAYSEEMGSKSLLYALAFLTILAGSDKAEACTYLPVVEVGVKTGPAEAKARARRNADARLKERARAAREALAAGTDAAAELADMIVPNVRPIPIRMSSCGPVNELDLAEGAETAEDWLVGTKFAGRGDLLPDSLVRQLQSSGETLGSICNEELRASLADSLRRRLTAKQMRDSYLFLAARRPEWDGRYVPLIRLAAFQGQSRRPPVRWLGADIQRWARRHPSGQALQQAADIFWRENEGLLGSTELACPAAAERWRAEQSRLVALIDGRLASRRRDKR